MEDRDSALVQQAILNLAVNGARITDSQGRDYTRDVLAEADNINSLYDSFINKRRRAESQQAPKSDIRPHKP